MKKMFTLTLAAVAAVTFSGLAFAQATPARPASPANPAVPEKAEKKSVKKPSSKEKTSKTPRVYKPKTGGAIIEYGDGSKVFTDPPRKPGGTPPTYAYPAPETKRPQ